MADYANESFKVRKGDVFFAEGAEAAWLAKTSGGKIDVLLSFPCGYGTPDSIQHNKSIRLFSIEKDKLLGIPDILGAGKYLFSYCSADDLEIEIFELSNRERIEDTIFSRKDLVYSTICTLSSMIDLSCQALKRLEGNLTKLCDLTGAMALFLCMIGKKLSLSVPGGELFVKASHELDRLETIPSSPSFTDSFVKTGQFSRFGASQLPEAVRNKIDYYSQLKTVPQELAKYFFGCAPFIMKYHLMEGSECVVLIRESLVSALSNISLVLEELVNSEKGLFSTYLHTVESMQYNPAESVAMSEAAKHAGTMLRDILRTISMDFGCEADSYITALNGTLNSIKGTVQSHVKASVITPYSGQSMGNIDEELSDSTVKILNYAAAPKDQVKSLLSALEAFRSLNDKLSADNESKIIRKKLTSTFFEIYKSVSRRALQEKAVPKLIRLFLNFGYMDENLLDKKQLEALYRVVDEFGSGPQQNVYNMHQWLGEVYTKSKSPSINEFGQDYFDVFREMRRQGTLSEEKKQEYENNLDGRLDFEVDNMLHTNQKLCYGQISTYFPILHRDMIIRDIDSSLVTPARLQSSINRVLEMDYSAFSREVSYRNNEYGIEKEFVMKAVQPDIILVPTFGCRAIMWQEISDRNRRLPGRFILPILTTENLDEMITKLIGNFRWELCRTMMGAGWNDVSQKSLTSEYTDYIQFFKKNSDLHEETKEKIKTQIQKSRGMMRDIFTSDYEIWLNYESKGMIRLNKAARSIFYRYCPFSREIRDQLEKQPAYAEPAALFNIQKAKMARELENKYNRLVKAGIPLDAELKENLEFYKDK